MDLILLSLACVAFAMSRTGSRYQYLQTNTFLGILLVPKDGTRDVHTVRIVFAARLGDCLLRPVVI